MADQKISELTALTGDNVADDDAIAIVDTSATETKKIVFSELKNALDTATGFVRITGDTMTGNLSMGDNVKAIFGAGSDLQIYHDGANSYIQDVGTGALGLFGSTFVGLYETGTGDKMVIANGGSDVELYYDNALKLATTSTGVDITGTIISDGLTVDTSTLHVDATNNRVGIGTSSPSQLAHLYESTSATGAFLQVQEVGGQNAYFGVNTSGGSIQVSGANPLQIATNGTERMRIDSSGNVGIGTSDPSTPRRMDVVGNASDAYLSTNSITDNVVARFRNGSDSNTAQRYGGISLESGNAQFALQTVQTGTYGGALTVKTRTGESSYAERMRIDSSGNVGIGTDSPRSSAATTTLEISGSTTARVIVESTNTGGRQYGWYASTDGQFALYDYTALQERLRIDSSGNLLVGKTAQSVDSVGGEILSTGIGQFTVDGNFAGRFTRKTSDGDIIVFRKGTGVVGSIGTDSNGDFVIDGSADHSGLRFKDDTVVPKQNGSDADDAIGLGKSDKRWKDLYLSGSIHGDVKFENNAGTTEYARFDGSGNLLVGKTTSNSIADDGIQLSESGQIIATNTLATANSGQVAIFNRKSTDGPVLDIRRSGVTYGTVGTVGGSSYIAGIAATGGIGFASSGGQPFINPVTNAGANNDNAINLGHSTSRFEEIYATNGTIQTSDRNEKQDIAELTDAEQRVAVAAKGLLRKFRWRDAVEAKGDEARTHFGIIAQDLQAAFAAEGLDAGDYAMFISSTWTDEETGEERTRMGVRYSELLAFIIAAI